jgi:membrane fusion protein (multidrug efflux system)
MIRLSPCLRRLSLGLSVVLMVAACKRGGAAEEEAGTPEVSVRTGLATRGPFSLAIHAIGTVAPRPGHVASLAAPAPTRVTRVLVTTGSVVHRGDPLVEFDRATFDAQAASAHAAEVTAEQAYTRAKTLVEAGIVARAELEQATAALAQARAAEVSARREQELATLWAPISAVVTRMTAQLAASADPSSSVVEMADPSALDIVFTVAPGELAGVRAGSPVTISAGQRTGSNSGSEPLGIGVVAEVGAAVDTASRGVIVRARLERPSRMLRVGETVFGAIGAGTVQDAVTIPSEALVPEGDSFRVFVVDSARIAHATNVTVGGRTESRVQILNGLDGGERVVTFGAFGVQDSAKVVEASAGDSAGGTDKPRVPAPPAPAAVPAKP